MRIIDPLGAAIAWFAPDLRAACAGYAVRAADDAADGWTHVVASTGPEVFQGHPDEYGCIPLIDVPGDMLIQPWELVERDPTSAVMETWFAAAGSRDRIHARMTAALDDGSLHLALDARNDGSHPAPVSLSLHLSFPVELVDVSRTVSAIRHALSADGTTVRLSEPHATLQLDARLEAGIRHLALDTPIDRSAVSLSMLASHEPIGLPAGSGYRLAASIRATARPAAIRATPKS